VKQKPTLKMETFSRASFLSPMLGKKLWYFLLDRIKIDFELNYLKVFCFHGYFYNLTLNGLKTSIGSTLLPSRSSFLSLPKKDCPNETPKHRWLNWTSQ
jgi:hypothetical protein